MTSLNLCKKQRLWSPIWVHKGLIIRQTMCPTCEVARLSGFFRRKIVKRWHQNQKLLSDETESPRQKRVLSVRCNFVWNLFQKKNKFISLFGPWEKNFKRHLKSAFYVSKGTFWASKKIWCEKSVQNASLLIKQSNPFAQIIRRNGQTSSKKTTYWEKDFLFVINFDEK